MNKVHFLSIRATLFPFRSSLFLESSFKRGKEVACEMPKVKF